MIQGMKTAKRCRCCSEQGELGTCGDCQLDHVCPDCWREQRCCALRRRLLDGFRQSLEESKW